VQILIPADGDTPCSPSARLVRGMAYGFAAGDDAAGAIVEVLETMAATPRPALWGTYWAIGEIAGPGAEMGKVELATQGICGFKDAPDSAGLVEIAYYTFPALEGRGIASFMVAALLRIADGAATGVIAHTLPEHNASCAVLARNGFTFQGEVVDPEDGPVWRWRGPRTGNG
jgi:RimJ/RimL family protein N-acetyltransferase